MPPKTPRRRPSQQRAQATVEAIVEAAAQVFERHGYAAGTTNRIAERAGVSIGSLYQYFDDKEAVLVAVAEQHLADGAQRLAPLVQRLREDDPPPAAALRAFLEAVVDLHRDRPRLHRLLFEEAPLPAALRDRVRELEDLIAHEVAAWLARRPDPPTAPLTTARLLVEAVETWGHRRVLHPHEEEDDDAFLDAATALLTASIS